MMEYGGIYLTNMSGNGIDHHFRQMMINQLSSPVEGYRIFTLHAGSGTRAHPEKRKSRKAAKPQRRHGTLKPQSRKAAMERASRKAAKLPWNAQSRRAAEPQSRRAASSATHAPLPAFIAAALPPPWIAEAAKPQSRKL